MNDKFKINEIFEKFIKFDNLIKKIDYIENDWKENLEIYEKRRDIIDYLNDKNFINKIWELNCLLNNNLKNGK